MSRLEYLRRERDPAPGRDGRLAPPVPCRSRGPGDGAGRESSRATSSTSSERSGPAGRDLRVSLLLEPYGYGLRAKLAYALRLVRGMILIRTSRYVVVDNAYLPVHVAPHPSAHDGHPGLARGRRAEALRGRHDPAAGRARGDLPASPLRCRRHLGRSVAGALVGRPAHAPRACPATRHATDRCARRRRGTLRRPWARAGHDHPLLAGRRVVLYAPTFRGRGAGKRVAGALDARALRAMRCRPTTRSSSRPTPTSTPSGESTSGYDVVAEPTSELNELLAVDRHPRHRLLVVDLRVGPAARPLVLLVDDLEAYERDPGLYLDYRREMIGTQVRDTAGVAAAILDGRLRPRPRTTPSSSAILARATARQPAVRRAAPV